MCFRFWIPNSPSPPQLAFCRPDRLLRLRFHDAIERSPGDEVADHRRRRRNSRFWLAGLAPALRLLVHCHFGISRSTAAMAMLIARDPSLTGDEVFARLLRIRPRAWPNSLMVRYADELLGRRGKLMPALGRLYFRQLRRVPDIAEFMRVHRPLGNRHGRRGGQDRRGRAVIVFYDLETTGLVRGFDQILQFGAVRTDDNLRENRTASRSAAVSCRTSFRRRMRCASPASGSRI